MVTYVFEEFGESGVGLVDIGEIGEDEIYILVAHNETLLQLSFEHLIYCNIMTMTRRLRRRVKIEEMREKRGIKIT